MTLRSMFLAALLCISTIPHVSSFAPQTTCGSTSADALRDRRAVALGATTPSQNQTGQTRRGVLHNFGAVGGIVTAGGLIVPTETASAAITTQGSSNGLAARLAERDPSRLSNSIFNIPPAAQTYPEFLRGTWNVQTTFGGFLFPSKRIPRDKIVSNAIIPGFQKCSIAAFSDVGKDVTYQMSIDPRTGLEDRGSTLRSQIDTNLGYKAVKDIAYNAKANPNRLSIDFVDYRTRNAERIELFCNARESEMVESTGVFVCSEHIRQVTFGTGTEVGVPRQVVGNYAHFWTWRRDPDSPDGGDLKGNLLTAAYLDPQDAMFFDEPSKPVAVYSHILKAQRA